MHSYMWLVADNVRQSLHDNLHGGLVLCNVVAAVMSDNLHVGCLCINVRQAT